MFPFVGLFLFFKDAPGRQKYFVPFTSLEESHLWRLHTNDGANEVTQLGRDAGLLNENTMIIASTRMGGECGGSKAGSCGGDYDYRVANALEKVEVLLDASEIDEDAIVSAKEKLDFAIELRNITSAGKRKGCSKGGKHSHSLFYS